eukprot:SAG31_NODE_47163_length_251_cov_1.013158_1_plen_51_part_10
MAPPSGRARSGCEAAQLEASYRSGHVPVSRGDTNLVLTINSITAVINLVRA